MTARLSGSSYNLEQMSLDLGKLGTFKETLEVSRDHLMKRKGTVAAKEVWRQVWSSETPVNFLVAVAERVFRKHLIQDECRPSDV